VVDSVSEAETATTLGQTDPSEGLETRQLVAALEARLFGSPTRPVRIGRFLVLERLGHGAMGIVYQAYDPELHRRVAIKVLPSAGGADELRERLQREAKALAQLNHPNVVTVFEIGVEADTLYMVMEQVEGGSLDQWCRRHPPGTRTRALQVIDMAIAAAGGLVCAHAAGLVHRDLKPANFLVGEDRRVRIADFGLVRLGFAQLAPSDPQLARDTSAPEVPAHLTATGEAVGTPAYMAPEQFEAQADAATDQFSFCATFWEVLYGERPFPGKSVAQIRVAAIEGRLHHDAPSRGAPSWIRPILARGLSADPSERYPDMHALLVEMKRRRDSKQPWLATVALAVPLVGATMMASPAEDERCQRAGDRAQAVWTEPERQTVQERFIASGHPSAEHAHAMLDLALEQWISGWRTARIETCETAQGRDGRGGVVFDLTMSCLDQRLREIEALVTVVTASDSDVELVSRAAELIDRFPDLEECNDSEALRSEVPLPADLETRARIEAIDEERAVLLARMRVADRLELQPALESLVQRAEATQYAPIITRTHLAFGEFLIDEPGDDAVTRFERAYFAAEEGRSERLVILAALALGQAVAEKTQAYEVALRWTTLAQDRIEDWRGDKVDLALSSGTRAFILHRAGRTQAALDAVDHELAIRRTSATAADLPIARALLLRGRCLRILGRYPEAHDSLREGIDLLQTRVGSSHVYLAEAWSEVGSLALMRGEGSEAVAAFELAADMIAALTGEAHPQYGAALGNLGHACSSVGRWAEAVDHARRVLSIFEAHLPEDAPLLVMAEANLAGTLVGHDSAASELHARQALARAERHRPEGDRALAFAREIMGTALWRVGRAEEAVALLRDAERVFAGRDEPSSHIRIQTELARVLVRTGAAREALEVADNCAARARELEGARTSLIDWADVARAEALLELGRRLEGATILDKALERLGRDPGVPADEIRRAREVL
jgi:tetratricopeptide (TPR) repeat protein/predicted Ser/Thr protein kinase